MRKAFQLVVRTIGPIFLLAMIFLTVVATSPEAEMALALATRMA